MLFSLFYDDETDSIQIYKGNDMLLFRMRKDTDLSIYGLLDEGLKKMKYFISHSFLDD